MLNFKRRISDTNRQTTYIAATTKITGTITGQGAYVFCGTVEGDVVAKQRVEIAGTARITGSLSGNSIAVAEGAIIEGEIKVMSGEQPTQFQEKRQA